MCGRYSQTRSAHELAERFAARAPTPGLAPRYNIAPSQDAPVVLEEGGGRALALLRWGLIPSWAKEASIGRKTINARCETLLEKPSFRDAFRQRRCLVVADGFYEWRKGARGSKAPMRIARGGALFAMAGLWDSWRDAAGKEIRSFTIVTTSPSPAVAPIHDRMPVILDEAGERLWPHAKAGYESLTALLKPWPGVLDVFEVSEAVNSPAHDAPDCLEPALKLL